jgi:hypothetical protein
VKVAHDWRTWCSAAVLYTLAGLVASSATGAAVGGLGQLLGLAPRLNVTLAVCVGLAALLAARELGVVRFEIPERKLQTQKVWMHEFGPRGAAVLWGLHLSLGFFTRVNYGGFWLLTLLALCFGDWRLGALLFGAHWVGKALPVWLAPLALRTSEDGSEVIGVWETDGRHYLRVQALGLGATAAVLASWLIASRGGL